MLTMTAAARPRWVIKTGSPDKETFLTTSPAFCLRSEIGIIFGVFVINGTSYVTCNSTIKGACCQVPPQPSGLPARPARNRCGVPRDAEVDVVHRFHLLSRRRNLPLHLLPLGRKPWGQVLQS